VEPVFAYPGGGQVRAVAAVDVSVMGVGRIRAGGVDRGPAVFGEVVELQEQPVAPLLQFMEGRQQVAVLGQGCVMHVKQVGGSHRRADLGFYLIGQHDRRVIAVGGISEARAVQVVVQFVNDPDVRKFQGILAGEYAVLPTHRLANSDLLLDNPGHAAGLQVVVDKRDGHALFFLPPPPVLPSSLPTAEDERPSLNCSRYSGMVSIGGRSRARISVLFFS
jgi:hypothetical protein